MSGKYRETCGHGFRYHYGFHLVPVRRRMLDPNVSTIFHGYGHPEAYPKEECDQPPLTWWEENMDRLTMERKYGGRGARTQRSHPSSPMSPGEQFFFAVVILFLAVCGLVGGAIFGMALLLGDLWEWAREHPVIAGTIGVTILPMIIGALKKRADRKRAKPSAS